MDELMGQYRLDRVNQNLLFVMVNPGRLVTLVEWPEDPDQRKTKRNVIFGRRNEVNQVNSTDVVLAKRGVRDFTVDMSKEIMRSVVMLATYIAFAKSITLIIFRANILAIAFITEFTVMVFCLGVMAACAGFIFTAIGYFTLSVAGVLSVFYLFKGDHKLQQYFDKYLPRANHKRIRRAFDVINPFLKVAFSLYSLLESLTSADAVQKGTSEETGAFDFFKQGKLMLSDHADVNLEKFAKEDLIAAKEVLHVVKKKATTGIKFFELIVAVKELSDARKAKTEFIEELDKTLAKFPK